MPSDKSPEPLMFLQPSKPFSISLGTKPKATPGSLVNKKKRPHSSLTEDSGSDNESQNNAHHFVSTFDQSIGGAVGSQASEKAKVPLVIAAQKNRDWRVEARRKKGRNLLPAEEQARRDGRASDASVNVVGNEEQKPLYGLIVTNQKAENGTTDVHMTEDASHDNVIGPEVRAVGAQPQTADEEAIEALLGDGKKKSNLVILGSGVAEERFASRITEENAFRSDVASRPDSASLAEYSAIPVEEFGLAILRGLRPGWKEGDPIGRNKISVVKPRLVEQRPALLGIGASKVPEGLEELGAWGKGAKKTNKIDRSYAPVVLKNTKTGEVLTEEELNARRERKKFVEDDWDGRKGKKLTNTGDFSYPKHYDGNGNGAYRNGRHNSSLHHERSRSKERQQQIKDRDRNQGRDRRGEHDYDNERQSDGDKDTKRNGPDDARDDGSRRRHKEYGDYRYDYHEGRRRRGRSGDRHRDRHRRKD